MRIQTFPGRFQSSALLVAIASLVASITTQLPAQSIQWDTNWIPDDTFLVNSLNVQKLLSYEEKDSKTRKSFTRQLESVGINIEHVQQMQMIFSGELGEDENFNRDGERLMVMKLVFSEAFDSAQIIKKAEEATTNKFEETEVNGNKLHSPTDESRQPSYCFPNDRTMLLGLSEGMEHVLASEKTMSGLVDRLKEADANNSDLFVTFQQNDTTREIVGFLSEQMEGIPFKLADIAEEAVYGDINFQFDDGKPIQARIKTKDADGAERLKRAVDALVGLGRTFLPTAKEAMKDAAGADFGDDAFKDFMKEQQEIQRGFMDVAEKTLEGFETNTDENEFQINVTVMGGIGNGVKLFGRQLASSFDFMEKQSVIVEDAFEDAKDAVERIEERVEE